MSSKIESLNTNTCVERKTGFAGTRVCSWDYASLFLLIGVGLFSLWVLPQLGVSWDEHFHHQWGAEKWDNYAAWFTGGISTDEFLQLKQSSVHPGFFDLSLQFMMRFSPWGLNQTGHALSAAFGIFGMLGTWLLGRRLCGPLLGFFVLCLLLCAPRYFGHMWFNPKDIPFAACYIWSVYALILAIGQFPRPSYKVIVGLGALTGFALGVRMAGLLIPLYFGLAAGVFWLVVGRTEGGWCRTFIQLVARGILSGVVAYLVALPFWPALWKSPAAASGLAGAIGKAQHFDWIGPVLFEGGYVQSDALPWYYLLKWLAITLPEWTLVLLCLAPLFAVQTWLVRRSTDGASVTLPLQWCVVALSAVFPLIYVIVTRPVLYDGMRHFLFILPPLMVIAGGTLGQIVSWLQARELSYRWLPRLPYVFTAVSCLFVLLSYSSLHPFYYVYFNGWVGGLRGAYQNYETDYWGLSYREAVEQMALVVASEPPRERLYTFAISGTGHLVENFIPEGFVLIPSLADADFYVAYTRVDQHAKGSGSIVAFVERDGVPLNVIWDQRRLESGTRSPIQ